MIISALFRAETLGRTAAFRSAMSHLISKALPQRCQIRNLREIVLQYRGQFHSFNVIIDSIVAFGMTYVPFSHPKLIKYVTERMNRGESPCENTQQIVTFTYLKFFVYMCIDSIRPLHEHMMKVCNWFKFCRAVDRDVQKLNMLFLMSLLKDEPHTNLNITMQNMRNTMIPTISHALHYISQWNAKRLRRLGLISKTIVTCDSISVPKSVKRIISSPLQSPECAEIKHVIDLYSSGANKKSLYSNLESLSASALSLLSSVLNFSASRSSMMVQRYQGISTDIKVYMCHRCVVVKNSRQPYTSLSKVIFDYHTKKVFCANCSSDVALKPIDMSTGTIIFSKKKNIHFVCRRCLHLCEMPINSSSWVCQSCSAEKKP